MQNGSQYIRQDPPAKYRGLFVWDMAFSASEKKILRVGYILRMSIALASTTRPKKGSSENVPATYGRPWFTKLEPCVVEQLTYITETGNSWKRTSKQQKSWSYLK